MLSELSKLTLSTAEFDIVLILVLMEDALGARRVMNGSLYMSSVLILVLMEDALGVRKGNARRD